MPDFECQHAAQHVAIAFAFACARHAFILYSKLMFAAVRTFAAARESKKRVILYKNRAFERARGEFVDVVVVVVVCCRCRIYLCIHQYVPISCVCCLLCTRTRVSPPVSPETCLRGVRIFIECTQHNGSQPASQQTHHKCCGGLFLIARRDFGRFRSRDRLDRFSGGVVFGLSAAQIICKLMACAIKCMYSVRGASLSLSL